MTKLQRILLGILCGIFLLSFLHAYLMYGGLANIDWEGVISLPLYFLIVPAFVVTFITCAIRGKYDNAYRLLVWTNSVGLVIALFVTINYVGEKVFQDRKAINEENIAYYRNSFGDARDEMVSLAIDALEQKPGLKGEYGIHSLGVNERDTVLNGDSLQYCEVKLIYFTGEQFSKEHAYTAKYLSFYNKTVVELYNKPILSDSVSIADVIDANTAANSTLGVIDSVLDTEHDESLREAKKVLEKSKIRMEH